MSEVNADKPFTWKDKVYEVIYEADTPAGKLFDVILLIAIVLSVIGVMLESVQEFSINYGYLLSISEWTFTILFTLEYILRIISVRKPFKYIFSFFGIVDLLSVLPTYLAFVFSGASVLMVIRSLRLLRMFRVLKLVRYVGASQMLIRAIRDSRAKITVFLLAVFVIAMIMGSIMYMIEGGENGFTSIPRSIYWAIVTLTTVGYGDISPVTPVGQAIATVIMILGYGIIAIPTGIISVELSKSDSTPKQFAARACKECSKEGQAYDAVYCKFCGAKL